MNQGNLWATLGTGIGLGMETPVEGIIVFLLALGTHNKLPHSGLIPIVGKISDDGETGATVCAIDEGIKIASIGRIKKFFETFWAGGDIGRDLGSYLRMDDTG
jgi:hypothetical protein